VAFVAVPDKAPGDLLTSAMWNTYIGDNLNKGVMRPIGEVVLGAPASSIDFTSIPADHVHLMLELVARGDAAVAEVNVSVRLNNDNGANYNRQGFQATNATVTASGSINTTSLTVGTMPGSTAVANAAATIDVWIAGYAAATFFKQLRAAASWENADTAAGQSLSFSGGLWKAAPAAVNRITLLPNSGNFAAGSFATLYGMGGI
jgi:hypothetical protein